MSASDPSARRLSPERGDESIDWEFRDELNPGGRIHPISVPIARFPNWVAGLTCGRDNEWSIVGFAPGETVRAVAVNEGERTRVAPMLPFPVIQSYAVDHRLETVIWVHNHPGADATRAAGLEPSSASEQDYRALNRLARILDPWNIRVLGMICIEGIAYEFFWRAPDPGSPRQLSLESVPGFDIGPELPDPWPKGPDGRFVERLSPWAKQHIWPRSPPPPVPLGIPRRTRRLHRALRRYPLGAGATRR